MSIQLQTKTQKRPTLLIVALLCLSLCATCFAEKPSDTPIGQLTMVKFLLNFSKFVTWPDSAFSSPSAPLNYCVMGTDDIGSILDDAAGSVSAGEHKVAIVRFGIDALDKTASCHLLYIGADSFAATEAAIKKVGAASTLTVGQVDEFVDKGGMVQFLGADRNVTLRLNKELLDTTKLQVSSKLYAASK